MLIILGKMQIGKVDRLSGKFCSVFVMLVEKKRGKSHAENWEAKH